MSTEDTRLAEVASRHYVDGRSRVDIAKEMGVSRFVVARLLAQAREQGVVRFEIGSPGGLDLERSLALQSRFGLRRAVVVFAPTTAPESIQQALGRAAADLMSEITAEGDVIGVTAGRTLRQMAARLGALAQADVVQLGGVAAGLQESGVELVRRIARISGGTPYPLLTPLLTQSPEAARHLREEPGVRDTISRFETVTCAYVGVGSWDPPDSQVYLNAQRVGLLDRLLERGVQAELGTVLLDGRGAEISDAEQQRVGIDGETLRRIPEVVAVAGGPRKTAAIRAALRSGLVTTLVCDAATATQLLLDEDESHGSTEDTEDGV
ncbi:transcriptional regulator [Leucobacter sp. CSA1]|uniref:Transcriptional regulator n=1 Tax=Leucobacter chromiisoli TaxID=2796471 RepID=A0A934UUP3_9MICO|nr:sugar-binding domain-containing protein [Leucobacter chromiisoli]MBK0418641.1 transcriptional regulator [Leucobacter chromiisoli]